MLTDEQRAAIVKEAKEWLGTRYVGCSRTKGLGCDCMTLLAGVYTNTGHLRTDPIPKQYSVQVGQHQHNTQYLDGVREYMREIPEAEVKPGDLVLYDIHGTGSYSHGALVVEWPGYVIHAMARHGVSGAHGTEHPKLRNAARLFFTLKD